MSEIGYRFLSIVMYRAAFYMQLNFHGEEINTLLRDRIVLVTYLTLFNSWHKVTSKMFKRVRHIL